MALDHGPSSVLCSLACALLLLSSPAHGQESSSDEGSNYWQDHFSIHGYLTLGYAEAELSVPGGAFLTADEVMLGIEEDGSFPYGNAALNLRYEPSPRHRFVLQVAAAELGESPSEDFQGDVELDWLFYEADLTDSTRLRLGRHPVPAGLFNEVRDAGVILPFFRPAYVFYREGALLSETVDGIAVSQQILPDSPWGVEATAYYGEFDVLQQGIGFLSDVNDVEAENAVGGQLWIHTPLPALRLGVGAMNWDLTAPGPDTGTDESEWKTWHASAELDLERWILLGEYRRAKVDYFLDDVLLIGFYSHNYYLQLGWKATPRWSFYLQPERSEGEQVGPFYVGGSEKYRDREDLGISVVFEMLPNLILRAEHHEVDAELAIDAQIVPGGPFGFQQRTIFQTFDSDYSIVSVSFSF